MKEQEFRQVCALFGCTDARILPFKDKPFKKSDEAVEAVRNIIYETRPNVLITQSPYLTGHHDRPVGAHNDHTDTAFTVMEAQMLASLPDYERQEQPHRIATTLYPGVYFMDNQIDFYVDVSEWAEQRVQAEMLFDSQGHTEAFSKKRIEISAVIATDCPIAHITRSQTNRLSGLPFSRRRGCNAGTHGLDGGLRVCRGLRARQGGDAADDLGGGGGSAQVSREPAGGACAHLRRVQGHVC